MPRRKKTDPPKPKTPRNKWQRMRDDALAAAGFTKADVLRQVLADGGTTAQQSVSAVLDGRYRNAAIESAFCALTKLEPLVAFPLDEPAYGRKPKRRNMTALRKSRLRAMAAAAGSILDMSDADLERLDAAESYPLTSDDMRPDA